jgi:hypothetical protein
LAPEQARLVWLRIGPSSRLGLWLAVVHVGALAALAQPGLPAPAAIGAAILVVASFVHCARRHALRADPRSIVAVALAADGLVLSRVDGTRARVFAVGETFVHPWLVAMRVGRGGRRAEALVVVFDAVEHEAFRALRVRLRASGMANQGP